MHLLLLPIESYRNDLVQAATAGDQVVLLTPM